MKLERVKSSSKFSSKFLKNPGESRNALIEVSKELKTLDSPRVANPC